MAQMETATLGGGCFWCIEAALKQLKGVEMALSGYCGGALEAPDYARVCQGDTGHIEVVRFSFDPDIIDYRTLLLAFFCAHDPTTRDRQGHDIGSQYRSVIFTHSEHQAAIAESLMRELDQAGYWPSPIVTEIRPCPPFWPAEESHQDYAARHPTQPYCQAVVTPKVAKVRSNFRALIKGSDR